jgi:hypothetical protein
MQVTIACVYAMLKEGKLDLDTLYATAAQLLPVLKTNLEDNDATTR